MDNNKIINYKIMFHNIFPQFLQILLFRDLNLNCIIFNKINNNNLNRHNKNKKSRLNQFQIFIKMINKLTFSRKKIR